MTYFTLPIVGGPFEHCWKEVEGKPTSELRAAQGEDLPLFRLIRQEEYRREPYLLAATLNALAREDIKVRDGRILDPKGRPLQGLSLDSEIEEAMQGLSNDVLRKATDQALEHERCLPTVGSSTRHL